MKQFVKFLLFLIIVFSVFTACGDDDDDNNDESPDDDANDDADADDDVDDDIDDDADDDSVDVDDDTDPGDPILPTDGYLARQAEYLQQCAENGGGIHAQVCKLSMDFDEIDEDAIQRTCDKINDREDCADFDLASVLRLLYLHGDHPS